MKIVISTLALSLIASAALAQTSAAPAQPLGGPAIPGVCLLSQQAVLANAKVGLAATARLKQIADAADVELKSARDPIDADAKALQTQQATLKAADLQTRREALQAKVQGLEQTAEQRRQEIELTRQKALGQISGEAQPVIAQVYKAKGCGLLLDRNSVLGGNMTGDLTGDVVKALDAKISTITFDRAALPVRSAAVTPSTVQR